MQSSKGSKQRYGSGFTNVGVRAAYFKLLTLGGRVPSGKDERLQFGDADGDGIATTINLRMAGQYFDQESGLYYNWNRYYDPKTGRYITSDLIGLRGGPNTYLYARANPLKYTDPRGLFSILVGGGGSAVVGPGAEASGGVVINPGLGDDCADAGLFASVGGGAGVNISADAFIGYVKGPMSNVSGETNNVNIAIGPISITGFFDTKSNELMGGTVGIGPGLPAGLSVTKSLTGTATVRDAMPNSKSCGCKR